MKFLLLLMMSFAAVPNAGAGLNVPAVAWPVSAQSPSLLDRAVPFEREWRVTSSEHFDITFIAIDGADLERIADTAERVYRRMGSGLAHDLSFRPLIVVFPTNTARSAAIRARSFPGNREHLLWAVDTPPARAEGDFAHELMHVFTFDIVPAPAQGDLPGWLHEGLAELQRETWEADDVLAVRDVLDARTLPTLAILRDGAALAPRHQRLVGHLALEFLVAKGGQDAVARLLYSLRNGGNPTDAYVAAIGLPASGFDREFTEWVRSRFVR
jgi:hypothetical protein